MNRNISPCFLVKRVSRRYLSTNVDHDYKNIAESVNEHVNVITSLWGMRNVKIKSSNYFKDDLMLKLAAKQLAHPQVDDLLNLSPQNKAGKLPNLMTSTKIIYEDSINKDLSYVDNDIWLGFSKYISFFNLHLKYPSKNLIHFINEYENDINKSNGVSKKNNLKESDENELNFDELRTLIEQSDDLCNHTIFVFPYLRKTSKIIVDTLSRAKNLLCESDFRSLVYSCGSTGSSRLLRLLGSIMNENFSNSLSTTPIHSVESYAWPWMSKTEKRRRLNYRLPALLDALSACSVIRYTVDHESNVYDYVMESLKALDAKIHEYAGSSDAGSTGDTASQLLTPSAASFINANTAAGAAHELAARTDVDRIGSLSELVAYDSLVLEKVLSLLVIKRNLDQLGNDQIRTFSDFVCDRLHRIRPKLLANLAFALGHSKNLDEFWMFMISKQIQLIIGSNSNSLASVPSNDATSVIGNGLDSNTGHGINGINNASNAINGIDNGHENGLNSVDTAIDGYNSATNGINEANIGATSNATANNGRDWQFDVDDVTAILEAYSTAGLEDYNFYSAVCSYIRDSFHSYSLHHKSVIIRSLAAVRHREVPLIRDFMESLKSYTNQLIAAITPSSGYSGNNAKNESKTANKHANSGINTHGHRADRLKTHLIKPIDSYIVATGIVSVCDLDYKVDEIDSLWQVLTHKVKDSSFDICAISWLPIATIIYPSLVSLTEFLPVWAKHVNYTINKLRSRAFMMTIQRRQLLLRHAFNLGILPNKFMTPKCKKYIDEICDKNYIKCKEDYMPESSTFHLEVCACLRALGVTHQREINVLPFVMDIVIPADKAVYIKSSYASEAERATDSARSGNSGVEGDTDSFPLRYNRNSPNHRKHKEEVYTLVPNS